MKLNETEFLDVLSQTKDAYRWSVTNSGQLRAKAKNHVEEVVDQVGQNLFSPLTAVTRFLRCGCYRLDQEHHCSFVVNNNTYKNLLNADSRYTTPYGTVLRNKMKRALKLG